MAKLGLTAGLRCLSFGFVGARLCLPPADFHIRMLFRRHAQQRAPEAFCLIEIGVFGHDRKTQSIAVQSAP
jgi:hypothetical protein